MPTKTLYSISVSAAIQLISFSLAVALAKILSNAQLAILIHALFALLLAKFLRLNPAWQIFNFLLPCALAISFSWQISSNLLLLVSLFFILIYLPTIWTGVPYYPSSEKMYQVVLDQLPKNQNFSFVDLGCGFGGLLNFLAKKCPNSNFVGVEIGPLPYLIAKLRFLILRKNIVIEYSDLWKVDLARFDYVYAFLAPGPMPKLWEKAQREMRPGTAFLINTFKVEAKANKVIEVQDKRKCILYVHLFN